MGSYFTIGLGIGGYPIRMWGLLPKLILKQVLKISNTIFKYLYNFVFIYQKRCLEPTNTYEE